MLQERTAIKELQKKKKEAAASATLTYIRAQLLYSSDRHSAFNRGNETYLFVCFYFLFIYLIIQKFTVVLPSIVLGYGYTDMTQV